MTHPTLSSDVKINNDDILRRYLDLPKLLDLLHSQTVYFRRADGFKDPLEGALFPSLRKSIDNAAYQRNSRINADEFYRRARQGNYVSCWTIGAKDNMALWQLFSGENNGVVITTTVERLLNCAATWNDVIHFQQVNYIDHKKEPNCIIGDYKDVLQFKNDAYKFENELRVIISRQESHETNPMGIRLSLPNLDTLIRSVVVAPEAEESYFEAVKDLCKRYGLSAPSKKVQVIIYTYLAILLLVTY